MKGKHSEQATLAQPIPKEFHSITPYLAMEGAEEWLEFAENAFDAKATFLLKHESGKDAGKIMHATLKIGDSNIMFSEIMENYPAVTAMLYLYVDDVDKVYQQALDAGAESVREVRTEFYGDRAGCVKDKWNNTWWIATHIEEVEEGELRKRAREFNEKNPA
jgi:PhnB protein